MKILFLVMLICFSQAALSAEYRGLFYVIDKTQYHNDLKYEEIPASAIVYGNCFDLPGTRQSSCKLTEIVFKDKYKLIYEKSRRSSADKILTCEIQEIIDGKYNTIFYKNFFEDGDPKNIELSNYVCKYIWGRNTSQR